jgi:hypothetical protein
MSGVDQDERPVDLPVTSVIVDRLSFTVRASMFRFAATMMKRTTIPLATEFALRLIHLIPRVTAEDLAAFFGFRESEIAVLIQDVLETQLAVERDGRFELSARGREAVSPQGDVELFAIEEVNAHQAFDLIAFAPIDDEELDKATARLVPELTLPDKQRASTAIAEADKAFELHFQEWLQRARPRSEEMRFRSVEDVRQTKSLAAPLAVPIRYTLEDPSKAEADFTALRQEGVPGARDSLIASLSGEIKRLAVPRDSEWALETLTTIDGGILPAAGLPNVAAITGWVRRVVNASFDKGADHLPVFGSVVGDPVRRTLSEWAPALPVRRKAMPLYWLPPSTGHWGRSVAFASLVRELSDLVPEGITLLPRTDFSGPDLKRLTRLFRPIEDQAGFDSCIGLPIASPDALEILVRPHSFALVLVHAEDPGSGYPLPVGYATRDPNVVKELAFYVGGIVRDADVDDVQWHPEGSNKGDALAKAQDDLWS